MKIELDLEHEGLMNYFKMLCATKDCSTCNSYDSSKDICLDDYNRKALAGYVDDFIYTSLHP